VYPWNVPPDSIAIPSSPPMADRSHVGDSAEGSAVGEIVEAARAFVTAGDALQDGRV
jgi:hypothetical protein